MDGCSQKLQDYTVCMSVYKNDRTEDFLLSVRSIYNQTVQPSEIILVVDGPVSDNLNCGIDELKSEIPVLKVLRLEKNMGHAIARQTALEAASHDLIAIMDSDDISVHNRFEQQLAIFESHPEVSVVGGIIDEFIGSTNNIVGTRMVPEHDASIKQYMKSRCPMNLVTVMMRKTDVMAVGGYIDWYCEEDYYLWIRMMLQGYQFYNIQEKLVNVRVGKEMYQRRGGKRYFKSEARLQRYMRDHKIISPFRYLYNVMIRWALQVAMPNWMRGWVFRTFARK